MTQSELTAAVNALLAPSQPITANGMHKPSMAHVITELYDADSRGAVLAGLSTVLSLNTNDKVLIIRDGQAKIISKDAFDGGGGGSVDFGFVDNEVPTGVVDGVNDTFTLASAPISGSLKLYNAIRLKGGGVDYTQSSNIITFTAPPEVGSNLLADYRTADGSGGDGVEHWRGGHSLASNAYPASGGSGAAGAIAAGDFWYVTTTGNLDLGLGSEPIPVKSLIVALVDVPGTTPANWRVI